MKYEYGVEYETNGEKPDLEGNVEIETQHNDGEWLKAGEAWVWDWPEIQKFRIVDERYKPKADDLSWHERGELPPAGAHCEVMHDGEFTKCFVVGLDEDGKGLICKVERKEGRVTRVDYIPHYDCTFRPIGTDRDKLIAAAEHAAESVTMEPVNSIHMGALIDAGWRPIKQQDEIEFGYTASKSCKNITVDDAMGLYRAGCRFIEQGE